MWVSVRCVLIVGLPRAPRTSRLAWLLGACAPCGRVRCRLSRPVVTQAVQLYQSALLCSAGAPGVHLSARIHDSAAACVLHDSAAACVFAEVCVLRTVRSSWPASRYALRGYYVASYLSGSPLTSQPDSELSTFFDSKRLFESLIVHRHSESTHAHALALYSTVVLTFGENTAVPRAECE